MTFRTQLRYRFGDIDAAGIAYYPKLLHYFHCAFEDWWKDGLGHPYPELIARDRLGMPAVRLEAEFFAPVLYGDEPFVHVGVLSVGNTSVEFGFWMTRGDDVEEVVAALEVVNPPLILDGGYLTVPGIFSHEHVDAGSLMLADNLPADLKGHVADFGAGWGYLSVRLALASTKVTSIDLFDASFSACIAAKANMSNLAANVESRVQWYDLLEEKPEHRYDAIIMNPPFHQTRAAEPSIGEGMIKAAAASLKLGGRLFMVANCALAYEPVLQASFARSGEIVRDGKFKILWAVR